MHKRYQVKLLFVFDQGSPNLGTHPSTGEGAYPDSGPVGALTLRGLGACRRCLLCCLPAGCQVGLWPGRPWFCLAIPARPCAA